MASISKQHSIWHLSNFYDLMNLHEIPETRSRHNPTSLENILHSITMNQSYSFFQSSRSTCTRRKQSSSLLQYIPLSASSELFESYSNDSSLNLQTHSFPASTNHSRETTSSSKSKNFAIALTSARLTFPGIQLERAQRS